MFKLSIMNNTNKRCVNIKITDEGINMLGNLHITDATAYVVIILLMKSLKFNVEI